MASSSATGSPAHPTADKIVVMRDGKVEQVGEALDLYDNPGNVFVAGFIGRIIRDAGSAYGVIAEG